MPSPVSSVFCGNIRRISHSAALRGLRPGRLTQKKIGFAFGSHGSRGGAIHYITDSLRTAGIEVINEGFEVHYRPDGSELDRCFEMGRDLGRRVKAL